MFRLGAQDHFDWPVTIRLPVSGGKYEDSTFTARFKRLPQDRVKQLLLLGRAGETTDDDVVREVLVGWGDDVVDGDSKPLPFCEANVARLLSITTFSATVVAAYFEAIGGAGRRKN